MDENLQNRISPIDSASVPRSKNIFLRFLSNLGVGGAVAGIVGANIIFWLLEIIFVWGTAVWVAWQGILLLISGHIIWGLVVLIVGVPFSIWISQMLLYVWVAFLLLYLIFIGISWIIGLIF